MQHGLTPSNDPLANQLCCGGIALDMLEVHGLIDVVADTKLV
ncbi:hypothetical protein BZL30_1359 [Mycobacterium kansasii]|uniref:Uncharacterized protein n=1 Tax=Mycobacterium kansasii TaxID=1768 RepID=A0A1V3XR44_MYCKA|nr:hypothetical protein BZL30_1359 [Mycobacterium kansasii]